MSIASSLKKKHGNQKNFRHIEIMIFTTFFVNQFFRTRYFAQIDNYTTHAYIKKFINNKNTHVCFSGFYY